MVAVHPGRRVDLLQLDAEHGVGPGRAEPVVERLEQRGEQALLGLVGAARCQPDGDRHEQVLRGPVADGVVLVQRRTGAQCVQRGDAGGQRRLVEGTGQRGHRSRRATLAEQSIVTWGIAQHYLTC